MKIFIVILLTSSIWQQDVHGLVTIQIEPENLQQIGKVLMQAYMQQQPIVLGPSSTTARGVQITAEAKKIARGVFQLFGIMITLVGANLLTTKLEQFVVVNQQEFSAKNNITSTMLHSDICEYDYGCDQNMCWRSCDVSTDANHEKLSAENTTQQLCYTSPNKLEFKFCIYSHECSPCWDCLRSCEANK